MARVNTSLTVACAPRRSRREMRDAVLTLAYLRGRWDLDGMDAGLCVFVSRPCSDGRADKRYSTTPWRGFAGRCDPMSHGKRTMPGPVAPGRSGSPSEPPNSVQMRTIRSSKQPPVREDWVRWAAIARSRFIAFVGARGCRHRPFEWRSNACSFRYRWIHEDGGHACDGAAAGASASNCRPESMTPTCGNQAMRRAGTTGAEVA